MLVYVDRIILYCHNLCINNLINFAQRKGKKIKNKNKELSITNLVIIFKLKMLSYFKQEIFYFENEYAIQS